MESTNDFTIRAKKTTPSSVFAWWAIGAFILLCSLWVMLSGQLKDCDATLSCQFNALIEISLGMLGMFAGAIMILIGFRTRSKAHLKAEEEQYRLFASRLETMLEDQNNPDNEDQE